MTIDKRLEDVLIRWESTEHSAEEKLDALEKYIFEHVGLKHDQEYYQKKGKFFERYAAGFIHRYIMILKEASFLLLDPLHIIDVIVTFVKQVFLHPIKLLKQIWKMWVWSYVRGAYGLGFMTADALLACIIAGAVSLAAAEGGAMAAAEASAVTLKESAVAAATYVPKKIMGIGSGIQKVVTSSGSFMNMVARAPLKVLTDAQKSIRLTAAFGTVKEYRWYADPFMKKRGSK